MLICHLYIFFGEVSVKIFRLFLNQVVFLLNLRVLCVLWTRVFYHMCCLQIFLPVCGLSSHSLGIVFQKF